MMPTAPLAARNGATAAKPSGTVGIGQPDDAVGAHLEQDGGQQHGAGGGRDRVGGREPGVHRPEGDLDPETDDEQRRHEHLGRRRQAGPVGGGEPAEVGGAALDDEHEDPEQHQGRPERREEHEPVGRRPPGRVPSRGRRRTG